MEQPEATRPQADAEGSPSGGGPPAKTSSVLPPSLAVPSVPDYDLIRRVGGGAYGEVWLARSVATGALRAAKIVWRHKFEDERPFRREFEGIQHFEQISRESPSQLALFHIGRNDPDGYFYYVMELADPLENPKSERKDAPESGGPLSLNPSGFPSPPQDGCPSSAIRSAKRGPLRGAREEGQVASGLLLSSPREERSERGDLPSALGTWASDLYTPHTLRAELEKGRVAAARVLEIGLALAEALAHLHHNRLVHRDVKPSNVIFVKGRPKLADIGLVTDVSDQCSIVGTEGYLPPEGPGTPQADIFALGKVLYEATTGMDRREFPKLPAELRDWPDAKLVFELNEIILKACASDARSRYPSVEHLLEELRALQGGRSIRRRRTAHWWWAACRQAAVGLGGAAALVSIAIILVRGHSQPQSYSDGPPSTNIDAKRLCRRAMDVIRDDVYEQFGEAYTNLLDAIKLDPLFARPWVGLLELRLRERIPGVRSMTTNELHLIADKLDVLLPHSAPAYCAHSVIEFYDWHFPQAEEYAQKAIAADPNYELAHTFYAFMLTQWGKNRLDEARKQLVMSDSLLTGKATIPRCLGHIAYVERDFHGAITNYAKALQIEPHHAPAILYTARAYQAMGDYTNAVAEFRIVRQLFARTESDRLRIDKRWDRLLQAYGDGGRKGYWECYRQEAERRTGDYYWKAVVQMNLGDTNGALSWLIASYTNHERSGDYETPLTALLFDEYWDNLRNNPQFTDLLEKMTFPQVMHSPGHRGANKPKSP